MLGVGIKPPKNGKVPSHVTMGFQEISRPKQTHTHTVQYLIELHDGKQQGLLTNNISE